MYAPEERIVPGATLRRLDHDRERKNETRRSIAMAGLTLALDKGPKGVTVADIASAANVSPRTVMNHFSSKDEVIVGIDPDLRSAVVDVFEARPGDESPLEALRATFIETVVQDAVTAEVWRGKSRVAREHPQLKRAFIASLVPLEDALCAAVARRTGLDPQGHLYPHLVAGVSLAALRAVLELTVQDSRETVEVALDETFSSLGAGLLPPATNGRSAARRRPDDGSPPDDVG